MGNVEWIHILDGAIPITNGPQKRRRQIRRYGRYVFAKLVRRLVGKDIALNLTLLPLKRRYDEGERTQELYDEIMEVE